MFLTWKEKTFAEREDLPQQIIALYTAIVSNYEHPRRVGVVTDHGCTNDSVCGGWSCSAFLSRRPFSFQPIFVDRLAVRLRSRAVLYD